MIMKNLSVVLIEPKTSGNVGAIARVMANFGFEKMVLLDPICSVDENECRARAKHAQKILDKAKVKSLDFLDKFDLVIGTTAIIGNHYNIKRLAVSSKDLKEKLPKDKKVAIVFGTEGDGMTNEQIERCDYVVTIPSDPNYRTLNLSQSVGIILYELFDHKPNFEMVSGKQKTFINKLISEALPKLGFTDERKIATQEKTWNQVLSKATMTKREAFVVMGFLKKVLKRR